MDHHSKYLKRCFELAKLGETLAYPNPIVGCVIVHEGKIIAEGFHRACGEAHAEVNAIKTIPNGILASECKIYVSLEPCSHFGKTPPCADLIIKHGFKELIFSSYDPNPQVSGKGIEKIRAAGIRVIEPRKLDPELKQESDYLNRIFFHSLNNKRPWVTLKLALDSNGSMLSDDRFITNTKSRKEVHRLRSSHDLIISGANSIRLDNSQLNVRYSAEDLRLSEIKDPDLCILYRDNPLNKDHDIFKIKSNRKVFQSNNLANVLMGDYKRIMIETGPSLSEYFVEKELVNEVIIYQQDSKLELNQDWQDLLKAKGFSKYKAQTINSAEENSDLKETWVKR